MNQDITIANKLWRYKFKRSNEKVQINLVIKRNKKIKIVLCFSSENYGFAFQEREIIEDLLEDNLSFDGWYLIPQYFITEVEKPFFKHNNITEFVLVRK